MSTQNTASSSLPTQRLLGKVALITGGATGIGESIVHLFHKHGAKVCIVDLQDELGDKLCNRLAVDSACFIHGDVTVEDDISKAVNFTVNRFGTLDILINNAGLSGAPCPDIRNNSLSEFNTVFDVNVEGAFLGMKHAARGGLDVQCSVGAVLCINAGAFVGMVGLVVCRPWPFLNLACVSVSWSPATSRLWLGLGPCSWCCFLVLLQYRLSSLALVVVPVAKNSPRVISGAYFFGYASMSSFNFRFQAGRFLWCSETVHDETLFSAWSRVIFFSSILLDCAFIVWNLALVCMSDTSSWTPVLVMVVARELGLLRMAVPLNASVQLNYIALLDERTDDALVGFRNFAAANANLKGVELTVDDVANVVLFLASDESRYVSGDNLMIDGAFTCTSHSFKVFRHMVQPSIELSTGYELFNNKPVFMIIAKAFDSDYVQVIKFSGSSNLEVVPE
uniref:3-oxoacyl-[acyl-carrier-protein] reductase n=1 Tax=Brassica campestris TaxID=3711 RepID=M4DCV6_BRACM